MSRYSVAEAKDQLPRLIDRAIDGEEVVITRRGEVMVELTPKRGRPKTAKQDYAWLKAQRDARPSVRVSGVDMLNEMYDEGSA